MPGLQMPTLGLGTWLHNDKGGEMRDAVVKAIELGYRNIDCAYIYGNEKDMGEAFTTVLNKGEVTRSELFIASKLWCTEHAADRVEAACRASLKDLCLDYFDLYLVHWPSGFAHGKGNVPRGEDGKVLFSGISLKETWEAMEKLVDLGLTKAIGMSNYNSKQLSSILSFARIPPKVLQVESNPRFNNEALRRFCVKNGIQMVAYSPFGSPDLPWGRKLPHILVDPTLVKIAEEVGKSTAQVVLRWQVQRGVGVIPKSIFTNELASNLLIYDFELCPEQCRLIDGLEIGERKIVPIIKFEDGRPDEIRDAEDENFPFGFEETFEEED